MKKTLIFISSFVLLACMIVGFNAWRTGRVSPSDLRALATRSDIVIEENTFRDGTVICLPLRNPNGRLDECLFGLEATSGEHYELLDVERAGPPGTIQRGDKLRVLGDVVVSRNEKQVNVVAAIRVERVQDRVED